MTEKLSSWSISLSSADPVRILIQFEDENDKAIGYLVIENDQIEEFTKNMNGLLEDLAKRGKPQLIN